MPATAPETVRPPGAHHAADGKFRNPWPGAEVHGFRDFLRWRLGDRRNAPIVPSPRYGSLPTRTPAFLSPRAAAGVRTVTWVGHSTVLMQIGALNILTDPVWSERASPVQWAGPRRIMPAAIPFDSLPPIDVVLLSHDHYDHLDAGTVRRLVKRDPRATWLCPLGVARRLRGFGVPNIVERDWWQPVQGEGFSALCTPAQHFSGRGVHDRNSTLWCGWTIETDGARVFFAGDTALHPEFADIAAAAGPFDLVLLPIGAYEPRWFMRAVHMDPDDAVNAYRALVEANGSTPPCVALHWGTFRLTDEPVDEPPVVFAKGWRAAGLPESLNWTLAHGETRRL